MRTTALTENGTVEFQVYISLNRKGQKRNAYRTLVRKPERKRPIKRSRCRWVDNIKMDL
jgi:hypothetical protein